jgi:uncharacterized DUF497 family protein
MEFHFEWDQAKNLANQRKHGLSFEEAAHAFADPFLFVVQDRIEGGEYRWQAFGLVRGVVLVMVAHAVREQGTTEVIRIISARYATPKERRRYETENG